MPLILAAALPIILHACDSKNIPTMEIPVSKSITAITVNEEYKSWNCIIEGNIPLTFTALNRVSRSGIWLYFPDTKLEIPDGVSVPSANEIIAAVDADEFAAGGSSYARISIGLKVDRPYSIFPNESGIKVSFPKTLAEPIDNTSMAVRAPTEAVESGEAVFSTASILESVTATPLKNHILVEVHADGSIMDYQSFTIGNPARIVFDINDVKSPQKTNQALGVDSKWVKQIRYHSYPGKIRLVLDTEDQFTRNYISFPTATGLLIYVGRLPEPLPRKSDAE